VIGSPDPAAAVAGSVGTGRMGRARRPDEVAVITSLPFRRIDSEIRLPSVMGPSQLCHSLCWEETIPVGGRP
jgi:hypothetical protein